MQADGAAALVTGGGQGIGRAVAERLSRDGYRVAVNARIDDQRLRAVVDATGAFPAPADIADEGATHAMVDHVEAQLGTIEVLVANAARMWMAPFLELPIEQWWQQLDVNLTGHLHLIERLVPGMVRAGRGRIVIVASYWGVVGWENATGYAASKSGLIALGRTLAAELGSKGVSVCVVAPGVIDTPQLEVDARDAGKPLAEMHAIYAAGIPAGRIGTAEEIAATIAFLASPDGGRAYNGQVLHPNGGEIRCTM